MEDESNGSGPYGPSLGSPESPCLKSTTSSSTTTTTANNNNKSSNSNNKNNNCSSSNNINKEQDRFLPIANVGRIMKKVIPGNGKISKDAKETVQECVSEFISFVTGEASDKCQREKRKTINGEDIIWAITTLGFEDYVAPLKLYISKYREIEGEKLNIPKQQRIEQRVQHQQQEQEQNLPPYSSVYSSTASTAPMSQPSFVATDQAFSLAFSSSTSIQKQLQQQDQIDSVGHW